jgi:hypothetical protein
VGGVCVCVCVCVCSYVWRRKREAKMKERQRVRRRFFAGKSDFTLGDVNDERCDAMRGSPFYVLR